MADLDARLNVFRPDLADERLKGVVEAKRFTKGKLRQASQVLAVHPEPDIDSGMLTQYLFGETVEVFEENDGWAWCQSGDDGYVGYVDAAGLAPSIIDCTHEVRVPRTYVYVEADLKSPTFGFLGICSRARVVSVEGKFSQIEMRGSEDGGWIFTDHLAALDDPALDFVAVAEQFINTPYLWGARDGTGLDCSGLIQMSLRRAGHKAPRDSDMLATSVGDVVTGWQGKLQRGDMVFWTGHCGIMVDADRLLHAHATAMLTTVEPVQTVIDRIQKIESRDVLTVRRL